jgi:hypothetical protein
MVVMADGCGSFSADETQSLGRYPFFSSSSVPNLRPVQQPAENRAPEMNQKGTAATFPSTSARRAPAAGLRRVAAAAAVFAVILLAAPRSIEAWSFPPASAGRIGGSCAPTTRSSSEAKDLPTAAKAKSAAAALLVGAAAAAASALSPLPAAASAGGPADFAGSYSDPFHPNCQRVIVAQDRSKLPAGAAVTLRGTDGNPGCPPDGSGAPWTLAGTADAASGSLLVDFSPKGGPANLRGAWEEGEAGGSPGIRWPDGNKWTKID